MNTIVVSTFYCSCKYIEKFVADFYEEEGVKHVKEYVLIKLNDHKSHLIYEVTNLEGFCSATSTPEMNEQNKSNGYENNVYSLEFIQQFNALMAVRGVIPNLTAIKQ